MHSESPILTPRITLGDPLTCISMGNPYLDIEVDFVLAQVKLSCAQLIEHLHDMNLMLFDGQ